MKKILLTVVVAVFALGVNNSFAGMTGYGGGMGPGMRGECMSFSPGQGPGMGMKFRGHAVWRYLMGLGLDEKQMTEIRAIRDRTRKETIMRTADVQVARVEFRELLNTDPVDMKKVEAQLKKIEGLRTEVRLLHLKAMEEVKAKLTPEQRAKLREFVETGPMMRYGRMRGTRNGEMGMPWWR